MTTEAQVQANRANAQKSTGPRTPEGKAKVARNALTHGLTAREAVVGGEDLDAWEPFRQDVRADLAPVGTVQSLLAERIAGLFWRLRRAEKFHTEAFDTMFVQMAVDPALKKLPEPGPHRGNPVFGMTVVKDFSETGTLERLFGYERQMEGSLFRAMGQLSSLKQLGKENPPAADGAEAVGTVPAGESLMPPEVGRGCEEPPGGGTTNGAGAGQLVGETKLIMAAISPVPAGGDGTTCKTKPISAGESTNGQDAFCQTKPISAQNSSAKAEGQQGPLCETKPMEAGTATDGQGESCKTKPIPVYSLPPAACSLPGHSCKTKPISESAALQVPGAQEVKKDPPRPEEPHFESKLSWKEGLNGPIMCPVGVPWVRKYGLRKLVFPT